MSVLATALLLALTRAEIIQRMRAPVITQADGLVRVFADCPEDMRKEFQHPVASFAAETVKTLYSGLGVKPLRFRSPGIVVHIGNARTNDSRVVTRVSTNGNEVTTRIYLKSPAFANLDRFRTEIVKGFLRSVRGAELPDAEAEKIFRRSHPDLRTADDRLNLERWLAGERVVDDEEALRLMRKVIKPGFASRRDVLTFASRLFLYPRTFAEKFAGRFDCLSFRDAIRFAPADPFIRLAALSKADETIVFGGGRGEAMSGASMAYSAFLRELAKGEKTADELHRMLDAADASLSVALEQAGR